MISAIPVRRLIVISMLLSLSLAGLGHTQELPPFVSRMTAEADDLAVRLSWSDAQGNVAFYRVYRHTEEITADTIENARVVATIQPGVMAYTDNLDVPGSFFYAVVAVGEDGAEYQPLVPFRNKTTRPVTVVEQQTTQYRPVAITSITATAKDDSVRIEFGTSRPQGEVIIYRSTTIPTRLADLVNAVLLDTISARTNQYIDYPIAGVPYYYAVFDSVQVKVGNAPFVRGQNVLSSPVELSLDLAAQEPAEPGIQRVRPLPFLVLSSSIETGESLSPFRPRSGSGAAPISDRTRDIVRMLTERATAAVLSEPELQILPVDRVAGEDAAPTALRAAIGEAFAAREWEVAVEALTDFLRIRREPRVEARAHFYLGQCFYLLGEYRSAFLHFLFAEEAYYSESQPWMTAILRKLQVS